MSRDERKLMYLLLIIIIIASICLIYKINTNPKYNQQLYNQIYSEYENMISQIENNTQYENENNININLYNETQAYKNNLENSFKVIGKINIPKINIEYPVIRETTEEYLKIAPTKLCGPDINEPGNLCIIGHNYKNNEFFSNLSLLQKNDKVYLTNSIGKKQEYTVYDKYTVLETDLSCINQDTKGKVEATLITCTKNKKERFVVKCIKE